MFPFWPDRWPSHFRISFSLSALLAVRAVAFTAAVLAVPASSPMPRLERIGSEHGLSHSCVLSILQDNDGYLWLGTLDGLNRYDGVVFQVLRHDPNDPQTLSHNIVRALHEDRAGRLWVGTDAGIDRLDETRTQVIRYRLAPAGEAEPTAQALFESRTGTLWLGTSRGLFYYRAELDRFEPWVNDDESGALDDLLAHSNIVRLQEDDDALWLLALDAGGDPSRASLVRLAAVDGDSRSFDLDTEGRQIYTFLIDRDGRLWLDANVDLPPELLVGHLQIAPGQLASTPIWALFEDAGGDVWVGSESGLGHATVEEDRLISQDVGGDWLGSFVLAINQDTAGALWLGTLGGLFRTEPAAKPFMQLHHDSQNPASLSSDAVSSLTEDGSGQVWVGTFGGGLNRVGSDLRQIERLTYDPEAPNGLCDALIWSLYTDQRSSPDRLWLGTESGLCSLDLESHCGARHSLPIPQGRGLQSRVTGIAAAEGNGLWLATFNGLVHFDPDSEQSRLYSPTGDEHGPSDRQISTLLRTPDALWLGTVAGTFDRLDPVTRTFEHHVLRSASGEVIGTEGIFDLHQDVRGHLWLATGAGLNRFDPANGDPVAGSHHFSTRDGLPGSVVYSIAADIDGRLWLGTNQGLSRFDEAGTQGAKFRNFSLPDGIGSHEFNRGAAFATTTGSLLFGGVGGLTAFDPLHVVDNSFLPPVRITGVRSYGRDGALEIPTRSLERLVLPPRYSTVTFEFAAISFTNAARNQYAYRLEGLESKWIDAGHQRYARYTNLPPGKYVFRVRGSNNDGLWDEDGAALLVTVEPTIWQTLWFRCAVALAVLGLAIALFRYRVHSLLAVERTRVRIASDLHDDLGSELSAVALVADFIAGQSHLAGEDRSRLAEIRQRAVDMVDALRDIVWYVNPEHDTMDATVRRCRSLAQSLLPEAELLFEISIPGKQGISMRARRDLYLIMKEAFHNIARHAAATRVEVVLVVSKRLLHLTIRDDGRGFDTRQLSEGHGLNSMQARVRALGAELRIESAVGHGTCLEVRNTSSRPWREFVMARR